MKKKPLKTGIVPISFIIVLVMTVLFTGLSHNARMSADSDQENSDFVGGGYAASMQIPGAYFLPVLYDATNGLPTSEANCILADSKGYIWIGGYSGIIKYDGVAFERLPVEDGLTSGRCIFEDSRGRIWVATNDSGVVILDGSERTYITKADGLWSDSIRTFAEDNRGNVFVGSTGGISYLDTMLSIHRIDDARVNNERILRLVSDSEGNIYGHTGNGGAFTVTVRGVGEFYKSSELGIDKITTILADPENPGKLYFGTAGSAVYYGRMGDPATIMKKISTAPTSNIHWLHYACGRLWVTSTTMVGYVDEKNKFIPFESLPMKDAFEMMTSDHQGNIWYASSRYGVMKLVADNFLDITGAAGIEAEVVNTTCMVGDRLFIGTDGGLRIVDKDYHSVTNYITDYFKNIRIRSIMNDSQGNTWFATFSSGIGLVYMTPRGALKRITADNGLPGNDIRCTYEMKDGGLVVGTNNGVAIVRDGAVAEKYGADEGLKNTVILTVCEGDNGNIYAGTDGDGLYILKGSSLHRIGKENGLGSDVIMRLKRDETRGVIWIITSNSVEYIKGREITKVTTFPYNNNFDVVFGAQNTLWFMSSQGIYIVDATDAINDCISNYKLFDRVNGLTSIPISHCYSGIDAEGNLYVAGQTGVSKVNIEELCDFSGTTIVEIESVIYDGKEIYPDASGTYRLPTESGRLQINTAILDYTSTNPLVRVWLEGMDDEGKTANQNQMMPLEYTKLPYGNYVLHLQLLDNKTREIVSEKKYDLIKSPVLFERWSSRILILILMLATIGILVWRIMTGTIIRKQYAQIQEARDAAERANTAKSRFLANMSHEIRTPINTIMGMDEMILREDAKNVPREYSAPVTGYARNIKYASESLLNLINDLLDISKIESGKMHLVEQEYDTEEMIRGISSMIRGRAEDKKLYFDLDIDETLPRRLYGDSSKIKQIVLNLLTNAVKYTDEGGFKLNIRILDRNEAEVSLQISVKDTGIGVKKDDLDKLFSAYERLDEVRNSNIQGTGLGLDISRQFAELMGGKLWCESVYGEGSEFLLNIKQKIVDETPVGIFHEETAENSKDGYMPQFIAPDADVLVVDDNPMNLNVIKGLLKPTKIFVTTAGSGEECLEKIESNNFNVVLLDHMMPGMDGIETVGKIREKHPNLPVYALTANSTAGGEEFYKSKGFDGYLTKPIDIVAVEHAIMKHLPDSMMFKPTEEDIVVEDNSLSEDMKWLESAEGISVEDGIRNSGGVSQYIFALNMFLDSIDDNAEVIEKAYAADDLKLATVKVHALKSSARIIGALKLSEDCQALENAGNSKDMDYIDAHRDKMLEDYRTFKEILKNLKGEEKSDSDKKEIAGDELADAYSALKDCIGQMDYDAVEMVLEQLNDFKLPEKDKEIIGEIDKAFKSIDWDKMEELISKV